MHVGDMYQYTHLVSRVRLENMCNLLGKIVRVENEDSWSWRWCGAKLQLLSLALLFWVILGAGAANVIRTLPGYDGELPFKLETGYVGVGKNNEDQLFYYFIESQRDPYNDRLLLWLTGGPGCSGLSAILFEVGPFQINYAAYNGSLPSLIPNPYAFTQVANIIFLDALVGTGFSYSTTNDNFPITDITAARFNYRFLQKWLSDHPNFLQNPLYIAGDSYSGIIVPILVQEIHKGQKAEHDPRINLQGYILGNPLTSKETDDLKIPLAHRLALLSDEIYKSVQLNCKGDYSKPDVSDTACIRDLEVVQNCISSVPHVHVLEPACPFNAQANISDDVLIDVFQGKRPWCRDFNLVLSSRWANIAGVREALHIRNGTKNEWARCSYITHYVQNVTSVLEYHQSFLNTSYRALVYSGDHDLIIPYMGTMAWIRSLNMTTSDFWKPWFTDSQAAGFTETYQHGDFTLTFATVLGAGHTAPEYKPKPCLKMLDRWLAHTAIHDAKSYEPGSNGMFSSL